MPEQASVPIEIRLLDQLPTNLDLDLLCVAGFVYQQKEQPGNETADTQSFQRLDAKRNPKSERSKSTPLTKLVSIRAVRAIRVK